MGTPGIYALVHFFRMAKLTISIGEGHFTMAGPAVFALEYVLH